MNFLQAVKELAEGRCKGIKREGWSKDSVLSTNCGPIIEGELRFNSASYIPCVTDFVNYDWQLVDPVPQYEDVEVVRWACIAPSGYVECTMSSPPTPEYMAQHNIARICKLTGTDKRPIKPKVKRREEIDATYDGSSNFYINKKGIPRGAKLFAEWEEP